MPFALDALRGLSLSQEFRSIVLAEGERPFQIEEAFLKGAAGIVSKELSASVLCRGIRKAAAGNYCIDRRIFKSAAAAIQLLANPGKKTSTSDAFGLTPVELSIISAIALGRSRREIKALLSIKENTLKHHLASIFDKTGVSNQIELVLFALHNHLASL